MPDRYMIIRHAEKPVPGHTKGVRHTGDTDEHSLDVRGWQRAGALIRFFLQPQSPAIAVPTHLIASGFHADTSRRPHQTISPLAHAMKQEIDQRFTKGQEAQVAAHCGTLDGAVLISWQHECIPQLARALAPGIDVPSTWADDCFDRVWVLAAASGGHWTFEQVPQKLLADDTTHIG